MYRCSQFAHAYLTLYSTHYEQARGTRRSRIRSRASLYRCNGRRSRQTGYRRSITWADDDEEHIIFEVAEVVESGVGRYATSPQADRLRASNPEHQGIMTGTPEMFRAFMLGIQANEFDGILPETFPSQENRAS